MSELFISPIPCSLTLQDVLDASSVYFQATTASELRACLETIQFVDCTITDCLLTLLDKASLSYNTEPSGNLCVYTQHGELLELTQEFIFVEYEPSPVDPEDDDPFKYFEWM